MIGRWTSAGLVFAKTEMQKILFRVALPYGAFGVFLLVNWIAGHELHPFYPYAAIIPILIIGDVLSKGNPSRQLFIYSILGISALLIGIIGKEMVSVYAFISVGLFCSTLWPCIYTLAIAGLGNKTNEGSGYLIMMIMGGGFISVLQGALSSDHILGIQGGYWVGVACFAYLAFYAWKVNNSLKAQGIALDGMSAGGH
jgi:MFS transporter, FHS family, L-fucose permease